MIPSLNLWQQDAFAILLAALNPDSHLLGISTVDGNAALKETTYNTLAVLQAIGSSSVPVFAGASKPLVREPCNAPEVHGASGLDGVTLLPKPSAPAHLLDLKYVAEHLMAQPPSTAWVVATGPLTNIANLLDFEPRIAGHIRGLSIMGGSIGGDFTDAPLGVKNRTGENFGNITPFAEFNIYVDPEAAQKLFDNEILAQKTTLIPLDLTHQVRGDPAVLQYLFGMQHYIAQGPNQKHELSVVRRLFYEILTFFADTYHSTFGIADGPPLHDPLAVWVALRPELFEDREKNTGVSERWQVRVTTKGARYNADEDPSNRLGQTVVFKSSNDGVRIPKNLEKEKFWKAINDALVSAEEKASEP